MRERWTRNFAGSRFSSVLSADDRGALTETFGPFTFELGLAADTDGITMPVAGWRFGRLPLPRRIAPRADAREFQDEKGRFRFDVRLTVPFVGILAHYRGWLEPARQTREDAIGRNGNRLPD